MFCIKNNLLLSLCYRNLGVGSLSFSGGWFTLHTSSPLKKCWNIMAEITFSCPTDLILRVIPYNSHWRSVLMPNNAFLIKKIRTPDLVYKLGLCDHTTWFRF